MSRREHSREQLRIDDREEDDLADNLLRLLAPRDIVPLDRIATADHLVAHALDEGKLEGFQALRQLIVVAEAEKPARPIRQDRLFLSRRRCDWVSLLAAVRAGIPSDGPVAPLVGRAAACPPGGLIWLPQIWVSVNRLSFVALVCTRHVSRGTERTGARRLIPITTSPHGPIASIVAAALPVFAPPLLRAGTLSSRVAGVDGVSVLIAISLQALQIEARPIE